MKGKIHYRCPMCGMNLKNSEVNKHLHNHSMGDYLVFAFRSLKMVEVTDEGVKLLTEELWGTDKVKKDKFTFKVETEELRKGQYIIPSSKYIGMVMGIDEDKVKKDEDGNVIDARVLGKAERDYKSGELIEVAV